MSKEDHSANEDASLKGEAALVQALIEGEESGVSDRTPQEIRDEVRAEIIRRKGA